MDRSKAGIFAAIAILLSLTGCGNKDGAQTAASPAPVVSAAPATPGATSAEAARYRQLEQQTNVVPNQRK